MSKRKSKLLKNLDEEAAELGVELFRDMRHEIVKPNWKLDIVKSLGFKVSSPSIMVPYTLCGFPQLSPYALLPMYDSLFFPVSYYFHTATKMKMQSHQIRNEKTFRNVHGVNPEEMAYLAERGKIVPYFMDCYEFYDEEVIKPLLQPGVPRISRQLVLALESLIRYRAVFELGTTTFNKYQDLARKDIVGIFGCPDPEEFAPCLDCLAILYSKGLMNSIRRSDMHNRLYICLLNMLPFSQALGAVFQTECKWTREIISEWSGLPRGSSLEAILQGIKVLYGKDMPLESYLDIFDSKTTAAVRDTVRKLLEDPLSRKYSERLSAKIFEVNQQVEELCKSRTIKLFSLVSDVVVYGGNKFIEYKSQEMIRIPKRGLQKIAEWLVSKGVDVHARLIGKDWAIAQISKARCKIEKCTSEKLNKTV